jgi:hypothetical protein
MYGLMCRGSGKPCFGISASRRLIILKGSCSRVLVDILSSHAAVGLGKNLFPLFARALDLTPDFFDDKVRIHPLADPMISRTNGERLE